MPKVLFICRANICRSPTAHGVFEQLVRQAGLSQQIRVDSAGTDAPYPGRVPDQRAQKVAMAKGYDIGELNAKQLTAAVAAENDYLIAMDDRNIQDAAELLNAEDAGKITLLLSYTDERDKQLRDPFFSGGAGIGFVPDPIDSGERAFKVTLGKIERACGALLHHVCQQHGL